MSRDSNKDKDALRETLPARSVEDGERQAGDSDLSLLEDSLTKSPWERMLANDDALNFAESLRLAMEKRHAKP